MAIVPGLISVTFRRLDVEEIAALIAECGLRGVEWGADVHVPPGDDEAADRARAACDEHGIEVLSYGSYWYAGDDPDADIEPILETAARLGTDVVHVWAGRMASGQADAWQRTKVERALADAGELATELGMRLAVEYHSRTLTDSATSAVALFEAVGGPAVRSHWQPPIGLPDSDALVGLAAVAPWLEAVHVFSSGANGARLPLTSGAGLWGPVLAFVTRLPGMHPAMIEFVGDNDPDQLRKDAATLIGWLESHAPSSGSHDMSEA